MTTNKQFRFQKRYVFALSVAALGIQMTSGCSSADESGSASQSVETTAESNGQEEGLSGSGNATSGDQGMLCSSGFLDGVWVSQTDTCCVAERSEMAQPDAEIEAIISRLEQGWDVPLDWADAGETDTTLSVDFSDLEAVVFSQTGTPRDTDEGGCVEGEYSSIPAIEATVSLSTTDGKIDASGRVALVAQDEPSDTWIVQGVPLNQVEFDSTISLIATEQTLRGYVMVVGSKVTDSGDAVTRDSRELARFGDW